MELVLILIGVLIVVGAAVVYLTATYNRLVNLRALVDNSWSNIDTELKRRYDLIPNLVRTVQGYARHEKEVLDRVVQARRQAMQSTGSPSSQAQDENVLVGALRGVFAVVEGYPQLKASSHFQALQDELVNTEDRIQAARRFYNGNVKDLNTLIGQVPSNLIARQYAFQPVEFFEIDNVFERQPVAVKY